MIPFLINNKSYLGSASPTASHLHMLYVYWLYLLSLPQSTSSSSSTSVRAFTPDFPSWFHFSSSHCCVLAFQLSISHYFLREAFTMTPLEAKNIVIP